MKLLSFSHSYSIIYVFLIILSAALGIFVWLLANWFDLGNLEHTFSRYFFFTAELYGRHSSGLSSSFVSAFHCLTGP